MKRYRINALVTISLTTYVTAESREEAIENCEAEMPQLPQLCHECSSNDGDGQWSLSGEIDGDPQIQSAELVKST